MIDISKFDTIIFDLGGVILDIEPERSLQAFTKLYGKEHIAEIYSKDLLLKFENGLLPFKQLLSEIEDIVKIPIDENDFKKAWTAMLIRFTPQRIEWIKKLKQTHKLFLLSNTNEVHYAHFSKMLESEYNVLFTELFDKVFLSHEMQLMKPNLDIFKRVLEVVNINPNTTLFIEDTEENAIAANKLGIETLLIPRNGNFYDYFEV